MHAAHVVGGFYAKEEKKIKKINCKGIETVHGQAVALRINIT